MLPYWNNGWSTKSYSVSSKVTKRELYASVLLSYFAWNAFLTRNLNQTSSLGRPLVGFANDYFLFWSGIHMHVLLSFPLSLEVLSELVNPNYDGLQNFTRKYHFCTKRLFNWIYKFLNGTNFSGNSSESASLIWGWPDNKATWQKLISFGMHVIWNGMAGQATAVSLFQLICPTWCYLWSSYVFSCSQTIFW